MACEDCGPADQWPPRVVVRLVDGSEACGTVAEWADLPADRISQITVGTRAIAGHQVYFLYPTELTPGETAYVLGGASVYERWVTEHTIRESGEVLSRRSKYVPDLLHSQVKLGWWWDADDG